MSWLRLSRLKKTLNDVGIFLSRSYNAQSRERSVEGVTGDTSQGAAVSNECLNPILDSNEDIDNAVGVGNRAGTVSRQDESGQALAPITSQTANADIELQRGITTSPPVTEEPDPITTCQNSK
jgi:hypothetical protein